ncbi:MAG TPA: hypothetical protein VNJ08_07500 [Bacteriovoracaceae bacterium]|nr:hypothetical protein [Bacteriovoracaceae bacterium]
MKILLLLLPLFSFSAWSAGPLEYTEEELNPPVEEVLIKKPEKYLRHESMIYDLNTDLGIKDQRQYTGTDRNRFSLALHLSAGYEHFSELIGLEGTYMFRTKKYDQIFWGAQFFRHQAHFDAISQNPTIGGAQSEASFPRPTDVKDTVLGFGPGVGYRFKLLLDFFTTENMFETVDVFINTVQLTESYLSENYRGYGLSTNYGIHKRAGQSYFYGGKFSYNVASVTRAPIGTESKSERSLSLGWLSVAFELGFFY